jgi:hypothetical protein
MKSRRILMVASVTMAAGLAGVAFVGHGQQPAQPAAPSPGPVSLDLGDAKPADESKFYKKPGYSPYAGRVFSAAPALGRFAPAHWLVGGRRSSGSDVVS